MARRGFTLIESLIVLFLSGLVLHALLITTEHYQAVFTYVESDRTLDFQQFLIALEQEIQSYADVRKIGNDIRLYNNKQNRDTQFQIAIRLNQQRVILTPGFHPLLYDVEMFTMSLGEEQMLVQVRFTNGQQFEGYLLNPGDTNG